MVDTVNDVRAAGALLREVGRRHVRSQREHLACSGIASIAECHVMTELASAGPLTSARLAERLGVDKGQLSRTLARMARAELLVRSSVPGDARATLVALSGAGRRRHAALDRLFDAHAAAVLAPLTRDERACVRQALALLIRAHAATPPARKGRGQRGMP